jgi:hypothetical protein
MRKILMTVAAACTFSAATMAQGPHELAVIVNARSSDSLKIAMEYASLRAVPQANLIMLDTIGDEDGLTLSPADFRKKIWDPVNAELEKREIKDRILALAYSAGFPTTVSTDPAISITGMTFLRCEPPAKRDDIERAFYASPLYADPIRPGVAGQRSRSLDRLKGMALGSMPLPSFFLAYTGERGSSLSDALACLKTASAADFSAPTGTVFFVTSEDVRSKQREWQYPETKRELAAMGVRCIIQAGLPEEEKDILGVMAGMASLQPAGIGKFAPGAFADHLTSFAAVFSSSDQTKCTEWLKAGAAGSAGTVVEPYALWPKFPHARIFVHYASGCTLLESFYQSVLCPLQTLPIGDPLCKPWAPKPEITLSGLPAGELKEAVTCSAEAAYSNPVFTADIEWYIDDKFASKGKTLELDPAGLEPGKHTLRIVAARTGSVRAQAFVLKEFTAAAK